METEITIYEAIKELEDIATKEIEKRSIMKPRSRLKFYLSTIASQVKSYVLAWQAKSYEKEIRKLSPDNREKLKADAQTLLVGIAMAEREGVKMVGLLDLEDLKNFKEVLPYLQLQVQ